MSTVNLGGKDDAVVIITRLLDAPRALVWKAITDPRHVAVWYGGPGFTNPICEMDLRPGGLWRHVMQAPNGMRFSINSVFDEVVEPERLSWRTLKDPERDPAPPTSHNTVTLTERDSHTEWTLLSRFDSIAERDLSVQMGFARMINLGLDRMAAHLAEM